MKNKKTIKKILVTTMVLFFVSSIGQAVTSKYLHNTENDSTILKNIIEFDDNFDQSDPIFMNIPKPYKSSYMLAPNDFFFKINGLYIIQVKQGE